MDPYNTTGIGDGGGDNWDNQAITSVTLALVSALASVLTIAYVKLSHKFSDKQETKVMIENEVKADGSRKSQVTIEYSNYESYSAAATSAQNGTADATTQAVNTVTETTAAYFSSASTPKPISTNASAQQALVQNLQGVLYNNHEGDVSIEKGRNHLTRDGLNTYTKVECMQVLSGLVAKVDNADLINAIHKVNRSLQSHRENDDNKGVKLPKGETLKEKYKMHEKNGKLKKQHNDTEFSANKFVYTVESEKQAEQHLGAKKEVKYHKKPVKGKDQDIAKQDLQAEATKSEVKIQNTAGVALVLPKAIQPHLSNGALSNQASTYRSDPEDTTSSVTSLDGEERIDVENLEGSHHTSTESDDEVRIDVETLGEINHTTTDLLG